MPTCLPKAGRCAEISARLRPRRRSVFQTWETTPDGRMDFKTSSCGAVSRPIWSTSPRGNAGRSGKPPLLAFDEETWFNRSAWVSGLTISRAPVQPRQGSSQSILPPDDTDDCLVDFYSDAYAALFDKSVRRYSLLTRRVAGWRTLLKTDNIKAIVSFMSRVAAFRSRRAVPEEEKANLLKKTEG